MAKVKRDITIGTVFALALVLVALAVMAIGGESRLFGPKSLYHVVTPTAEGLTLGSPVKMAGVQVGSVSGIRLPTDPAHEGIELQIGIDRAYAQRVRADSSARLRILLYLSGEKFVEVIPGSSAQPELPEGAQIPIVEAKEMMEKGEDIAQNLSEITVSLRNILASLEQGEGLIGQMLKDPEFGRVGVESMGRTVENLERLTQDLLDSRADAFRGRSTVGRLLYDEALGARLDTLGTVIDRLALVMEGIERREGALGELLVDGGAAEQALHDLRDTAASLKQFTATLESDRGIVGRLLHDREFSEGLASDLQATLAHARAITGKIDRGEGTLGALVNERTLHDGAEEVVTGINDSRFARWLLRHYQKKGIRAGDAP